MDDIQIKHERAVGDDFIRWYNRANVTRFSFDTRPREAPDLGYVDGSRVLNLELTDAYYDEQSDAAMQWDAARQKANAPDSWSGGDFDQALIKNINAAIAKKCRNDYGKDCVLIVAVRPGLTTDYEMEQILSEIKTPQKTPFIGIYLTGNFPWTDSSRGGFRCWRVR
jgi:hypothetical protein